MSPEAEKSRREALEEMVRQDPHNAFARYGLAMEVSQSDPHGAWLHFDFLLQHHPEYTATYYQAGTFLTRQGRVEEARKVLVAGAEVTARLGNQHARSEILAALDDLKDE